MREGAIMRLLHLHSLHSKLSVIAYTLELLSRIKLEMAMRNLSLCDWLALRNLSLCWPENWSSLLHGGSDIMRVKACNQAPNLDHCRLRSAQRTIIVCWVIIISLVLK